MHKILTLLQWTKTWQAWTSSLLNAALCVVRFNIALPPLGCPVNLPTGRAGPPSFFVVVSHPLFLGLWNYLNACMRPQPRRSSPGFHGFIQRGETGIPPPPPPPMSRSPPPPSPQEFEKNFIIIEKSAQ